MNSAPKTPGASLSSRPADVELALTKLGDAEVVDADADGIPQLLRGTLGRVDALSDIPALAERQVRDAVTDALAAFRMKPQGLALRKMNHGVDGRRHFRYVQKHNGMDVVGGDVVISIDGKGTIYSINGTARGDFPAHTGQLAISKQQAGDVVAGDPRFAGMAQNHTRRVYVHEDTNMVQAYEIEVTGTRSDGPFRDLVYVDADAGAIVAVHPQMHSALNRLTYTANNTPQLPGTLMRNEWSSAVGEADIDSAHNNAGVTYNAYLEQYGRDSYDGAGATIKSSVHYSTNYCNAVWTGTQMFYGDGNGTTCKWLARAIDVTAHELTHAVTGAESQLAYSGESGGINESLSDSFAAFVEAYANGRPQGFVVDSNTFLIGEIPIAPFLRNMCDPYADGISADYYTDTVGALDVHYSSGVGNLMFCLLSNGGTHPRGKSAIVVPGLGIEKAADITYYAAVNLLTSNDDYLAYKNNMLAAADALYGANSPERAGVLAAFEAVGVGVPQPPPPTVTLTNGQAVSNLAANKPDRLYFKLDVPSNATSLAVTMSGGTGDADLYVKRGDYPTKLVYDCRPNSGGNNETCTFNNPPAGTWYIMLDAYSSFSGVTLKATADYISVIQNPFPYIASLTNGVSVTNISGAASSTKYWKVTVPAGKKLTVAMSGGVPDADLYVREGSLPTTSAYSCRPYTSGNNETCTFPSTNAATYYVMIRGYTAYSGVSLKATY